MNILSDIAANLERGDSATLKELMRTALSYGIQPEEILNESLIKGMDILGVKFQKNQVFIPEVLIATRAMKAGVELLRPFLKDKKGRFAVKVVMGTVKGDLHDIGKRIVEIILERVDCQVIDLGIDVPKERFLTVIKKEHPDIIGLSALLTTTMIYMREIIEAIEKARLRKQVKIIVGGGPVTSTFAYAIKADGYAPDAFSAVDLINKLMRERRREPCS